MTLLMVFSLVLPLLAGGTPGQRDTRTPTPEERARIERLRGEFEHLAPEARKKLLARAHALRERERQLERELTPEARQRFDQGSPEENRRAWHSHVRERIRTSGRELYEKLPGHLRRRLERLDPEERRALVERLLSDPEGLGARTLRRLSEHLALPEGERRHFEELSPLQRLRRLHELERETRAERRARRRESR